LVVELVAQRHLRFGQARESSALPLEQTAAVREATRLARETVFQLAVLVRV